jgi:hypothetical protein
LSLTKSHPSLVVLQSNCGPRVSQFAKEGQGVHNAEGTKNFPSAFEIRID